MSISVADNFSYQGTKPLDARFQFSSVANMKAAAEATLYNGCFAYVTATKKYYSYDSSNSVDTTLGRWREYESGGVSDYTDLDNKPQINGNELSGNKTGANLGLQNQTLSSSITIEGVSKTTVEDALSALNTQSKPEKYTGAGSSSGTINKSDIVAAGCTKTFYWVWPSGSSYGTNPGFPLPFDWTYASADITYLLTVTKNSDETYIEYVCNSYFTYGSRTYSKLYTKVATKSGSIWTFPDWIETNDQSIPMIGTINRSDIYDTTEKVVGKWHDGRPVYQKTFSCGAFPNDSTTYTPHGISNLLFLVSAMGFGKRTSDSMFLPIYYANGNNATSMVSFTVDKTNIIISTKMDRSNFTSSYVTLQYTKSSDAANSYNYADANDYSESEKIVGKWINGKTVYQKTFNADVPNVSSDGESNTVYYPVGSNVDMFVSLSGVFTTNAGNTFPFERMAQLPSGLPGYGVTIGGITNSGTANKNTVFILNTKQTYSGTSAYVTAQYTKV